MMILIDTSIYIAAIEDYQLEQSLEKLSQTQFIQSCDTIDEEIHEASEFLRKTSRKQESEELKLIYSRIRQGNIRTTERIIGLAQQYHKEAELSKKQHKNIDSDFLIVASASVAGVKNILSFNRKTMASAEMASIYSAVNKRNNYNSKEH